MARGWRTGAIAAGVALLTWVVLSPVLENDFVNWDDHKVVLENPRIRSLELSNLRWMFETSHIGHYQPLTWLTLAIDHALWGLDAGGYHLTSLLLHSANALLLFLAIRALLSRSRRGAPDTAVDTASAAAALLFALHPLRVEPVAWVADRGTVLCTLFLLVTLLGYVRVDDPSREGAPEQAPLWTYLTYTAALLAKGWAITLPFVMLVLDALVLGRLRERGAWKPVLVEKLPYAAMALVFGLLTLGAKAATHSLVGMEQHGALERLLQASYGIVFYLVKTLLPLGLSPIHPLDAGLASPGPVRWASAALVVAVTAGVVWLRRSCPALLATWLAYLTFLAPVLGLTQAGPQLVAERYSYVSFLPWAALVGAALLALARTRFRERRVLIMVVPMLVALGAASVRQIRVWRDGETLWARAVTVYPESAQVRFYWANTLRRVGDLDGALEEYARVIDAGGPLRIDALNNRSAVHRERGELDLALRDLDAAIAIRPTAPLHYNRGLVRWDRDEPGAEADWREAIRLDPGHAGAHRMLGWLEEKRGNTAAAVAHYERALETAELGWPLRDDVERRLAALRDFANQRARSRAK